jgi:hypothetical protein
MGAFLLLSIPLYHRRPQVFAGIIVGFLQAG